MQRRKFLILGGRAAAGISALGLVPRTVRVAESQESPSVLVVGAGLAGLTAAYELRRAGAAITLLEADSRPGGRVRTLRSSFADGLYAEAGGQTFFPIVEDYVAPYLDEFGLQRTASGPSGLDQVFVMRGERIVEPDRPNVDWPLDLFDAEQASGLAGMQQEYLAPLRSALNGAPSDWDWEGLRDLDEISLEAWMAGRGASADAIELVNLARMDFSVLPASSHSALAVAIGQESFNRLVGRPFSVEGGNDRLVRAFADRLQDHIRYGARVHRVQQSRGGIEIEYTRAGRSFSLQAAQLVCALPPWALNEIAFEPRLSQQRRSALTQLPTSNVCRFFIQTSQRVWREQGLSGSAVTDRRVSYFWESSPWLQGPRGILHGWIGTSGRTEFERMSPQERSTFAVAEAETVFPGISDYVEGVDTWCWGSDPVVPGHGIAIPPGQFTSSVVNLARPEGRIHFAGTETAPVLVKGFLQGAVASGRRAAVEVLEAAR